MGRNQDIRSGGERFRDRDEDEGRYSRAEYERRYGRYTENDEGDSSLRAGSYDEGRARYGGNEWRERQDRDSGEARGSQYEESSRTGYGGSGRQRDSERAGSSYEGRDSDYGYGRGGQPDYGQGSRRSFGSEAHGGQFRQSAPGGFGQAQGTSAWRGHGVEEQVGDFRSWGSQQGGEQQYRQQGQHRGKGPKGYQRSDDRLKEMLCERLRDDPEIDASEVSVNVQNGRVTFDGTVDSRQTKNLIEDVAEQLGIDDVQNNLRVQRPGAAMEPNQQAGAGTAAKTSQASGRDDDVKRRSN